MKDIFLRYRFPIVLFLSLLCVASVVGMTRYYFLMKERELRAKIEAETKSIDVVVAKADLPTGTKINGSTVAVRQIPSDYIPDGAIFPKSFSKYEGMVLSEPISSGKPLLRHHIKGIARAEKFSDLLQPGQRALTIQVDGISSVEHMVESGDYVDLAVKYKKSEHFELLLDRVLVLSTGNVTTADPKAPGMYKSADYSTITIGVDDRYVQKILEAGGKGDLTFLLRNEKDEYASRYQSAKSKSQVTILAAKNADSGLLKEVKESAIARQNTNNGFSRNEEGRIIRKSSAAVDSGAESADVNAPAKEAIASHE